MTAVQLGRARVRRPLPSNARHPGAAASAAADPPRAARCRTCRRPRRRPAGARPSRRLTECRESLTLHRRNALHRAGRFGPFGSSGKDKQGKSACAGKCAGFRPPLIASGKPLATAGAKSSLLGTTKRGDGRLQVTYNHHPLYTFVQDTRKGQTNGEEVSAFGAEWYAISTTGAKIAKHDAASGGGDAAPGGYDYGY